MRLGAINDQLKAGSHLTKIMQSSELVERHRHRYEVNPEYLPQLESQGMNVSALSKDHGFIDAVEIKEHPWFIGVQFHPEFTSKPLKPSRLFVSYIKQLKQSQPETQAGGDE